MSYRLNVEVRGLEILMYLHTCNLVSDTFTHCVLFSLKHYNINSSNISRILKQTAILCFSFRDNVLQVISTTIFSLLAGRWAGWAAVQDLCLIINLGRRGRIRQHLIR